MNKNINPICKTFVVKIASRCNINCSYCYMYNMGDESYKGQPKVMSIETLEKMITRAKEHCLDNNLNRFTFVLHGGEPLLAGKKFVENFVNTANTIFKETQVEVFFTLQTNGLLLTDDWCQLLKRLKISLGISLDGLKEDNDKNRKDHKGNGTYDKVIKALTLTQKEEHTLDAGLLSVININSSPTNIYKSFKSLNVFSTDFLIPEANYDSLPIMPNTGDFLNSETPYGDWLIELFNIWFNDKDKLYIRRFQQYIYSIMGADINGDDMGNSNNEVLVIETNGDYEAVDALKICGNNFTKSSANVSNYTVSQAMETKLAKEYYSSHFNLPSKCIACPISETCGGGYIPHRYSSKNGFNNPSVYCNDLLKLITHIQNIVIDEIPYTLRKESGIEKITYENALEIIKETLPTIEKPKYTEILESFSIK
ncbi:radical SAM protein [Flavobacterium sediminilitoris]|uniref:Radical SAM protein n=1 Tax=Flavobacterium sediminilitoris TaxID=2024526 RepID=A0ABY4HJE5_9FLAO|nr:MULTISPECIES: radical SAM protein [Flavobacterium]UOX32808.1 radical SAM protein [Flavobacterium sediminilitoris]